MVCMCVKRDAKEAESRAGRGERCRPRIRLRGGSVWMAVVPGGWRLQPKLKELICAAPIVIRTTTNHTLLSIRPGAPLAALALAPIALAACLARRSYSRVCNSAANRNAAQRRQAGSRHRRERQRR